MIYVLSSQEFVDVLNVRAIACGCPTRFHLNQQIDLNEFIELVIELKCIQVKNLYYYGSETNE